MKFTVLLTAFLLLFMLLSACSVPNQPAAVVSDVLVSSVPRLPPDIPSPTSTLTFTPTPIFTSTNTPTPSPTVTPTPSPALPLVITTPFPKGLHTITADNIAGIREIAYWGSPNIRLYEISPDGKFGFIAATNGVVVFNLATTQIVGQFEPVRRAYPIDSFSISTTGQRFVVLTASDIEVYDLADGMIFSLPIRAPSSEEHFSGAKISPDGRILAVRDCENPTDCSWEKIKINLYDVESEQNLNDKLDGYSGYYDFAFSPDGSKFVIYSSDQTGVIWQTTDWSKVRSFAINPGQTVTGFSPDGKLIAFQDDNLVLLYRIEEWKLVRQISVFVHDAPYTSRVIFSPDGTIVGIQGENEISIWSVATGELLGKHLIIKGRWTLSNDGSLTPRVEIPAQVYEALQFEVVDFGGEKQYRYTDQQILTAQYFYKNSEQAEGYYYLGCVISLGSRANCQEHPDRIYPHQDGIFYTLRQTSNAENYEVIPAFIENGASIGSLNKYGAILWVSRDNNFGLFNVSSSRSEIWDLITGSLVKHFNGYITHFDISPDGRTLALVAFQLCGMRECGEELVVYNLLSNRILYSQTPPTAYSNFTALEFAPDGELLYSIQDNTESFPTGFFIFNPATQEVLDPNFSINTGDYNFSDITFSPDGDLLAMGMPNGLIRIFDSETYAEIISWQAHQGIIDYIEFTPDSKYLLSGSAIGLGDGYLRAWGIWP